jgi:hypothetical protein
VRKELASILAEHGIADELAVKRVDELCATLAAILTRCPHEDRKALLDEFGLTIAAYVQELSNGKGGTASAHSPPSSMDALMPPAQPVPMASANVSPEVLEWARHQYTDEEIMAGIREIQETGGLELRDFIHELEAILDTNA